MTNAKDGSVRYIYRGEQKEEEAAMFAFFIGGKGMRVRKHNHLIIDQGRMPVGQVLSGFDLLPYEMKVQ